jgi:hypothetical protein
MTEPCQRFFRSFYQLWTFLGWILSMHVKIQDVAKTAAGALLYAAKLPGLADLVSVEESTRCENQLGEGVGPREVAVNYKNLIREMWLCRAADSYLTYLSEELALVFRTRPETMKSPESVKLDVILGYSKMEDLISALAERRVHDLSYQGMQDLTDYLKERLGFDLFPVAQQLNDVRRIVETRNLIVHNRGVVNRVFLSRLPSYPAKPGEQIDLSRSLTDTLVLAQSVADIDPRAAAKFRLPTPVTAL